MVDPTPTRTVAVDANVIINLIHIGRLDLLSAIPGYAFVIPEEVVAEITDATQQSELNAAVSSGHVRVESITDPEDLARYAELRRVLGRGETACLVLAQRNAWLAASDEKRRFRREALDRLGPDGVISTPGLLVLAIRAGALSFAEADEAKDILERHRFRMSFVSFRDVIDDRL